MDGSIGRHASLQSGSVTGSVRHDRLGDRWQLRSRALVADRSCGALDNRVRIIECEVWQCLPVTRAGWMTRLQPLARRR